MGGQHLLLYGENGLNRQRTQPVLVARRDIPLGEVTKETTYGFFSDTTTIDFEGTEYEVFMRLDVPEDGTYEFDIVQEFAEGEVPVVIGQYPDHDLLAAFVVWTVVVSIPLGIIGFVVFLVGLILWLTGRSKQTPPPPAYYPPTV